MNINNCTWVELVVIARILKLYDKIAIAKSIKRKFPKRGDKLAKARVILKRNIRLKLKGSNYGIKKVKLL